MRRAMRLWMVAGVFGVLLMTCGRFALAETGTPLPDGQDAAFSPARLEAVRLQGLCLLADADSRAATIKVLRAGEVVRVLSEKGPWARIEVRGETVGYVLAGYLTGAAAQAPALYRDKLVAVSRRPGPGDAPGVLLPTTAAPEDAAPAQAAQAAPPGPDAQAVPPVPTAQAVPSGPTVQTAAPRPDAGASGVTLAARDIPAVAVPARPDTPAGEPVGRAAMAPDAAASPDAMMPIPDPAGVDTLLAYVVARLKAPSVATTVPAPAQATADPDRDLTVRTFQERAGRFAIEVYLADCKLVLYEKQPDGLRHPAKTYAVATPAGDVEAPEGWGVITQIEFEPWWRPTESMKRRAKLKGRTLPDVMAPGVKNPMGPFKMHLSHGFAFRIHGNNDPKSIGRRVTNGCIRMRNDEGLELAKILDVGTEVVFYDHAPPPAGQSAQTMVPGP